MEQQLDEIQIYKHTDNCKLDHCANCSKCLRIKYTQLWHIDRIFYHCKKCSLDFKEDSKDIDKIYINKEIQEWIKKLTDLFCLDHTPLVILYRSYKQPLGHAYGRCGWYTTPIIIHIKINKKGKISLKTLIHEFLHATGYYHQYEINGWAHFGKIIDGKRQDNFCELILKDLTGKKHVFL